MSQFGYHLAMFIVECGLVSSFRRKIQSLELKLLTLTLRFRSRLPSRWMWPALGKTFRKKATKQNDIPTILFQETSTRGSVSSISLSWHLVRVALAKNDVVGNFIKRHFLPNSIGISRDESFFKVRFFFPLLKMFNCLTCTNGERP